MIIETLFKGTKAIQLENENLRAIVIPDMGGGNCLHVLPKKHMEIKAFIFTKKGVKMNLME